ncbi:MAG: UvrD-helicase domain-containing protein [Peptococcaceae bacterium]|nr:UvrD-helicase domain-containing protein [Peptococcaceae bacterium]
MPVRWMPEQLEAIETRGGNLLVAAAAGSGKTSVLVERIIRRITDPVCPVDIDRLLVVTFTNAAASEMRERIARALSGRSGGPASPDIQRQAVLLNRAQICTIHSFCLELLRQYFYRIGLDPSFRVADGTEAALIQLEVLEDLFEQRYAAGVDTPFTRLVECYGGNREDASLARLVLEVYRFSRSTPDPGAWLGKVAGMFDLSGDALPDQLPWSGVVKDALAVELEGLEAVAGLALRLAGRPGGPGGETERSGCDGGSALASMAQDQAMPGDAG